MAANKKRGGQPAPLKCCTSSEINISHNPSAPRDQDLRALFGKHRDLIRLRRAGKSLEEIAIETGDTRLGVLRKFRKMLEHDLKLALGLPR
jgi:hypothetical protein